MAKYFTMKEMTRSSTAVRRGIDNTPDDSIRYNLEILMGVLDVIRDAWGSAINVTSGYRCPALNKAVNGSKTSAHLMGFAADLKPVKGTPHQLAVFIRDYCKEHGLLYDQIIKERSGSSTWCHFGLYSPTGMQRRQFLSINL